MSPKEQALQLVILHLPHCTSVTKTMTMHNAQESAKVTAQQLHQLSSDFALAANFIEVIEAIDTVTMEDVKNAEPVAYHLM